MSTVAHELRSPLTSVKGFTATLLAKWPRFTDDQKRVMLETVNADADRVTRLITELLDVSRIEAGRIEVHRQLVDMPERARKVIAGRVAAGEAAARFRLEVGRRACRRPGWTPTRSTRSWRTLSRMRSGTGLVPLPPWWSRPRSRAALASRCPSATRARASRPSSLPRVFRQFWRAKRRGGAGLGLFIVKGLVEAHGGTIDGAQAPGGGAEFRFTMPAGTPEFG